MQKKFPSKLEQKNKFKKHLGGGALPPKLNLSVHRRLHWGSQPFFACGLLSTNFTPVAPIYIYNLDKVVIIKNMHMQGPRALLRILNQDFSGLFQAFFHDFL